MERTRSKPKNNGTRNHKEYSWLCFEPEVANEFRRLSGEYRILYSEMLSRMLKSYQEEVGGTPSVESLRIIEGKLSQTTNTDFLKLMLEHYRKQLEQNSFYW